MTWNDLIARLNEIPENRREETAIFSDMNGDDWEIDDLDQVDNPGDLLTDARADGEDTVYILTP